jgi:hypothetical protein
VNEPNKKWWRNPFRIVPLALIALTVIGILGFRFAAGTGLEKEIKAIRARGLPADPAELDRWYTAVPADQNAALKYLEARAMLVEPPPDNPLDKFSWREVQNGQALRKDIAAAAEEYVDLNSESLALLHSAAIMKRSRYPVDLSMGTKVQLPHLAPVKRMTQLLKWEALIKAERGDVKAARQSLLSSLALSNSLRNEPLFISELVRMACMALHLQALEFAVNRLPFDEPTLLQFEQALFEAEVNGKRAIQRAMIGERSLTMLDIQDFSFDEYARIIAFGSGPKGYDALPEFLQRFLYTARRGMGMHASDVAFYVQSMGEIERATGLELSKILHENKRLFARIDTELTTHPLLYLLSSMILPSFTRAAEKEVMLAARLRCASAALAIQRFRAREGKLPHPDALPSVLKEWPKDPVDGNPLSYEPAANGGFQVKAIAASALANQGRAATSTNWQDVAFTLVAKQDSSPRNKPLITE